MLTLSLVMIPWDWMGIVTIRSDTFRSLSTTGMMKFRPGSRTPMTRPRRKSTPLSYCVTILIAMASPMRTRAASTITTIHVFMSCFLPAGHERARPPSSVWSRPGRGQGRVSCRLDRKPPDRGVGEDSGGVGVGERQLIGDVAGPRLDRVPVPEVARRKQRTAIGKPAHQTIPPAQAGGVQGAVEHL